MKSGWAKSEKFDYSGVSTDAPAPPDEGLYRAKITKAAPQPTKEGNPMIKLTVELFENEDGEPLPKKRTVFDNLTLSEAALWRVLLLSEALDIKPIESSAYEDAVGFCRTIVEAAKSGVFVKIKHESYTNRNGDEATAARVDRYMSDAKVAEAGKSSSSSNGTSSLPTTRRPRKGDTTLTA